MKKILVCFLLFVCLTGGALFAWEPSDLLTFPDGQSADDWILNLGVGVGNFDYIGSNYYWLPTFRLTFDKNVEIGDQKLPFFFGGLVGYSSYGYRGWKDAQGKRHGDYYVHAIPVGFRVGYHFNWKVENLDTYAVTTAGARFYFGGGENHKTTFSDWMNIGFSAGARYFVSDNFGFWAEFGWASLSVADIGISFKF